MPTNATQVPPVRTFQFDGGEIGSISKSVNLFRGDVNITQTLVTLPGRNGLEAALTLFYGSNVKTQIKQWNRDAPTGIVGLGWNMPLERIVQLNTSTAAPADHTYALVSGADTTDLLPTTEVWLRLRLPPEAAGGLDAGTVADDLQAAFNAAGLRLSPAAEITATKPGQDWRIIDRDHQRTFSITRDADGLAVLAGGQGYEIFNYQFWQIRYYPEFERWEIAKENGITSAYGGLSEADLADHAIQWGVRWGNWIGSSMLSGNNRQSRYPTAWNLRSLLTPWGDEVRYSYAVVEQAVGAGGLTYTKACYIAAIRDMYGRTLTLDYREKSYIADQADGPREYLAPHWNTPYQTAPDNQPVAYQDRYETRYLDSATVRSADGTVMSIVQFDYTLLNFSGAARGTTLYGDTVKRCLTGLRLITPGQDPLPGMSFEYAAADAPNPGGLKSIRYPQGGSAHFSYDTKTLDICRRSLTIENPWPGAATPRVWFGPDYGVVTWYNADTEELDLRFYTWVGHWREWRPADTIPTDTIDSGSMSVLTSDTSCVISFQIDHKKTRTLVYRKNELYWGTWFEYAGNPVDTSSSAVDIVGGDDFFLINNREARTIQRYSWDRRSKDWFMETVATGSSLCATGAGDTVCLVAAGPNYHTVLCYDRKSSPGSKKNRLQIFNRDGAGTWHAGGSRELNFTVASTDLTQGMQWATGASFLAVAYTTNTIAHQLQYDLMIVGWDESYQTLSVQTLPYTVPLNDDKRLVITPSPRILDNAMIASGPHLLRYNGETWLTNDGLVPVIKPSENTLYWFAYGPDCALATQNASTRVIGQMQYFDPTRDTAGWQREPIKLLDDGYPKNRLRSYYPTAGRDYCSFDQNIYSRGTHTGWSEAVAAPFTIPGELDTTTLANAAPAFMAYLEIVDKPTATVSLAFRNGTILQSDTDRIAQRMFQPISNGKPVSDQNGRLPTGTNAFFTFLPMNKELAYATSITLHRDVDDTIDSAILDYPIRQITISDGYDSFPTLYDFDSASATCDPAGNIVKYYKSTVYSGATDAAAPPAGRTEQYYLNSLAPDQAPISEPRIARMLGTDTAYSMLDGMLYKTVAFDSNGRQVSMQETEYAVYTSIIADGVERALDGGFVRSVAETQVTDGITRTTRHEYDLASGQEIRQSTTSFDATGVEREIISETLYAFQVYDWFRQAHVLSESVQSLTRLTAVNDPADTAVLTLSANTMAPFTRRDADGTERTIYSCSASYAWRGGAGTPAFRWWDGMQPTADWQLQKRILNRSLSGLPVEQADADGQVTATIFDLSEQYPIAQFVNASVAALEASYCGFEAYEPAPGWSVDTVATPICTDDAQTGARCLLLPGSSSGPTGIFAPKAGKRMIFSCWYKTPENFTPGAAGWQLTLQQNGRDVGDAVRLLFENSGARWAYLSGTIAVPDTGIDPTFTLTIVARNPGAQPVWIDDLRVAPLLSDFHGSIYDPDTAQLHAAVGPQAQVSRYLYDGYHRQIAQVGPVENVASVNDQYVAVPRSGGSFDPVRPSAGTAINCMGRSSFARFGAGSEWRRNWQCPAPQNWEVEGDTLFHRTTGADTLRLAEPALTEDYGLSVNLDYADTPASPLGITIGSDVTLTWSPADRRWSLTDRRSGATISAQHVSPKPEKRWLLLVLPTRLFFFADGSLMFSYAPATPAAGLPGLSVSGEVGIYNLVAFERPAFTRSFTDGAGKGRQTQVWDETGFLITGLMYDKLGKGTITTQAARCDAGNGEALVYRSDFITGFDWQTGVMTGLISSLLPAAEGYPYTRTVSEASPLGRPVEIGAPGRLYAITGLPPEQRHTTRMQYGNNSQGSPPVGLALPAGQYGVIRTTDPNGNRSYKVTQKTGADVASGAILSDRAGDVLQSATLATCDNTGQRLRTCPPNYFAPPAGSAAENWVIRSRNNLLGQVLEQTTPDNGTTRFIYDCMGRRRFVQDAAGAAGSYVIYSRYDEIGRLLEEGSFDAVWGDGTGLQGHADDQAWPHPSAVPSTVWTKRYAYDGDGSDPDQIGQMTALYTRRHDQAEAEAVVEHMRYDRRGVLVARSLAVPDDASRSHTVTYENDNAGRITRIDYGDGDDRHGAFNVVQHYDRLGNIDRIAAGTVGAMRDIARFSYTASGDLAETALLTETGSPVRQQRSYNAPGWPTAFVSPHFRETLAYAETGNAYYDGRIARLTTDFDLPAPPSGFVSRISYGFRYDAAGRLISAADDSDPRWNFAGPARPASYDANGNFLDTRGEGPGGLYRYNAGRNQVHALDQSAGTSIYTYDPRGNIVSGSGYGFGTVTYDRVSNLPGRIAATAEGGTPWQFAYDGRKQRVVKQGPDGRRIYVFGMHSLPLLERQRDAAGRESLTRYVYGPAGLLLVQTDTARFGILNDHLGSPRLAIDSTGEAAAGFNYLPFGGALGDCFGAPEVLAQLRYRFTGQELDDDLGLYNFRARLYDTALGRFWAVDPVLQPMSPYAYANNQPFAMIDPTGKEPLTAIAIGLLISVVIGAVAGLASHAIINGAARNSSNLKSARAWGSSIIGGMVAGVTSYATGGVIGACMSTVGVTGSSLGSALAAGAFTGGVSGGASAITGSLTTQIVQDPDAGVTVDKRFAVNVMIGIGTGAIAGAAMRGYTYSGARQGIYDQTFTRLDNVNGSGGAQPPLDNVAMASAADTSADVILSKRAAVMLRGMADAPALDQGGLMPRNGILSIVGHGDESGNFLLVGNRKIMGDALARSVEGLPQRPQSIELMVCNAGRGTLAQTVANETGLTVRAADSIVRTQLNLNNVGPAHYGLPQPMNGGQWGVFKPMWPTTRATAIMTGFLV